MRLHLAVLLSCPLLTTLAAAQSAPVPASAAPMRAGAPTAAASAAATANARPPFTADDLVRLRRLSDPQVSPDGRWVSFTLRETDIEANRGRTDLWLLELGAPNPLVRRLTQNAAGDTSPRWSPDSRSLYFLSTRSGSSQVGRSRGTPPTSARGDRRAATPSACRHRADSR